MQRASFIEVYVEATFSSEESNWTRASKRLADPKELNFDRDEIILLSIIKVVAFEGVEFSFLISFV